MPALLRILLALSLLIGSPLLRAQDAAPAGASSAPPPPQALAQLRKQLDGIKTTLSGKQVNVPLADLRSMALDVQQRADGIGDALEPQLASLQAKLTVLGPVPAQGAPAETPQMRAQRRQLDRDSNQLKAEIDQARQLSRDGLHLSTQIASLRRERFQTQLGTRTATPFSRAFWSDLRHSLPGDLARLGRLGGDAREALAAAWQPPGRWPLLLCLLGAALVLLFGHRPLGRRLLGAACRRLPDGHLRRSAMAVGTVLSVTLDVGLAALLAHLAVDWNDALGDELDELARALVTTAFFAAYVAGLGHAVLSARRSSWRLPALSDEAAQSLRALPWLLGAAALLLGALERISGYIGASLASTVFVRAVLALVISGLVGLALARLARARRHLLATGEAPVRRPLWVGVLLAALGLGVVLAWLGVVTGYLAFAFFIAWQMLWLGVIVATVYLLAYLLNDACNALLDPKQASGRRLQAAFGLSPSALAQAAAVLSGVGRVLLVLCGVAALLAPFGAGPQELLGRVGHFFGEHQYGGLVIKPGAVLRAIVVFTLGLMAIRAAKRWLIEQVLPHTALDAGVQSSAVTLLGYVTVVVVFALALSIAGVSLQNIAWIASALSVGIGFGLQAIVQNFISGLILLAEQPVKVGDWVSLSGVEGDIRRISVRATEIQLGDRSTVIVPNSQLITQNVRNVTRAGAQGRVRILLPMPLDTDAAKARECMLDALQQHPATLDTPAPMVRLDEIVAGSMNFSAVAYVHSPRDVAGVRSDLLFDILRRFADAGLPLSTPQSMVVRTLGPLGEDSPAVPQPAT
ncbi:DUF3772 domain-containing protein [Fulvimonas sp. R45]|uniref:DUF3772 domain-containing protein n=1 Tax=Fulvimonas sp. R45 TaxID=3045937 RepID=UPI00265E1B8B|nr:DUF3772 domain-containing protein [Fulvimonas sp. R45]MDO1529739.1 DUF3772 domain-containing protein [Fulvimonas sp. R45]